MLTARERAAAGVLVAPPHARAGQAAREVGERTTAATGDEVAIEERGIAPVEAGIESASRLGVVASHAGVALHRVAAVGLEVAELTLVVGTIGVVAERELQVIAHAALHEQRAAGTGHGAAVARLRKELRDRLLEAAARRAAAGRVAYAIETDDAFEHPDRE